MGKYARRTVQLGDLVVAAFNKAAQFSTNPKEVSRLATRAVVHVLQRAGRTLTLQSAEPVAVYVKD